MTNPIIEPNCQAGSSELFSGYDTFESLGINVQYTFPTMPIIAYGGEILQLDASGILDLRTRDFQPQLVNTDSHELSTVLYDTSLPHPNISITIGAQKNVGGPYQTNQSKIFVALPDFRQIVPDIYFEGESAELTAEILPLLFGFFNYAKAYEEKQKFPEDRDLRLIRKNQLVILTYLAVYFGCATDPKIKIGIEDSGEGVDQRLVRWIDMEKIIEEARERLGYEKNND